MSSIERSGKLLSDQNQLAFSQTLKNINELSADLVAHKQEIQAALQGIKTASEQVGKAGASVAQAATGTEATIHVVGQDVAKTLKEASVLIDKLQNESTNLSGKLQDFTDTSTLEFTNMSRDVRDSADSLSSAGKSLSNPRAALFGSSKKSLGPGEK